jgi:hypothetical protein
LLSSAFFAPAPYLVPQVLALCGMLSLLFFSLRGRLAPARWAGALRVAYLMLAGCFFLAAAVVGAFSAVQFHTVHWVNGGDVLVLDRPAPLGPVALPKSLVASVTEFAIPERTLLGGRRPAVQYEVITRSGESYWSASLHERERVDALRNALIAATDGRLMRFRVGKNALPQ